VFDRKLNDLDCRHSRDLKKLEKEGREEKLQERMRRLEKRDFEPSSSMVRVQSFDYLSSQHGDGEELERRVRQLESGAGAPPEHRPVKISNEPRRDTEVEELEERIK
jgi:hypothetical protein